MNLKNFFIASLIIHIVGAIALYFYYNPIAFKPQPVGFFEESDEKRDTMTEEAEVQEQPDKTPQAKAVGREQIRGTDPKKGPEVGKRKKQIQKARKKRSLEIKKRKDYPKPVETKSSTEQNQVRDKKPNVKEESPALDITQNQALSEAVEPPSDSPGASIETIDSPIEFQLEEVKEEIKGNEEASKEGTLVADEDSSELMQESEDDSELEEIDSDEDSSELMTEPESDKELEKEFLDMNGNAQEEALDTAVQSEEEKADEDETSPKRKKFKDLKQRPGNPPLDDYPDFARRQGGMQGIVSVLFFVTEQGLVEQIQLNSSSGHKKLDNFVLRKLQRYEFLPGQSGWVQHDILFNLKGEEMEKSRWRQEE